MIEKISIPIIIKRFSAHDDLKLKLLKEFNILKKIESPYNNSEFVDIKKGDWEERWNKDRDWCKIFQKNLMIYLDNIIDDLGYSSYLIKEIWYQQYTNESFHTWHVHDGSLWSNIYYLELTDDSLVTEFIDPITKKVIKFNVKEGDIITFPSQLIHRSPKNLSNTRKTIISWNLDTTLDSNYSITKY